MCVGAGGSGGDRGGIGIVHGLRELTDPGINWERRMEKPGVEREAGGQSKLLGALWDWGRLSTELNPSSVPRSLVLYSAAMLAWALRSPHTSLSTQKGVLFSQVYSVLTCKVPGERRCRSRKRQALAGEPGTGGFSISLPLKPTVLVSVGSSASSLLPPERTHNNHVTSAISPRLEQLHWDSTRLPCPRMVTFSKLHSFCAKLFAE